MSRARLDRSLRSRAVVAITASCLCGPGVATAVAQIPDSFMNLQVLPKTIARRDLVATMRGFTAALGVRCTHCHVGPDNLEGMDFATDTKDAKKAARTMIRMTQAMNDDFLPKLPDAGPSTPKVTCATCHRGSEHPPRPLADVLADVAEAQGATAAIARYRELRESVLEQGLYDFRSRSLMVAAGRLRDAGKTADAVALAQSGGDLFPADAPYSVFVGQLCSQLGDLGCAESALSRAIQLEPGNETARQALDAVRSRRTVPPPPR